MRLMLLNKGVRLLSKLQGLLGSVRERNSLGVSSAREEDFVRDRSYGPALDH